MKNEVILMMKKISYCKQDLKIRKRKVKEKSIYLFVYQIITRNSKYDSIISICRYIEEGAEDRDNCIGSTETKGK